MNIVALDTATEILGVSLRTPTGYFETTIDAGLHHSEYLLPAIDSLMRLAGGEIAFGLVVCMRGPGSFTGLRIGMATAKGLAEGSRCPLVAVPTLEVLADGLDYFPGTVVPVIDARKRRVYAALFENGKRTTVDLDIAPADLAAQLATVPQVLFTGPGAHLLAANVQFRDGWRLDPSASSGRTASLLRLGEQRLHEHGGEPIDLGPVYLRDSEAQIGINHSNGGQRSGSSSP